MPSLTAGHSVVMPTLKHRIIRWLSSTVPGECLSLLASNAWRAVKRPVYPSSIRPDQFDVSLKRLLAAHLERLLPVSRLPGRC